MERRLERNPSSAVERREENLGVVVCEHRLVACPPQLV